MLPSEAIEIPKSAPLLTPDGHPFTLGPSISHGSTAEVYDHPEHPDLVIKVIHPSPKQRFMSLYSEEMFPGVDRLKTLSGWIEGEFASLSKRYQTPSGHIYPAPGELLFHNGQVIGYSMEKIPGQTLREYSGPPLPPQLVEDFIDAACRLATPQTAHRDLWNPRTGEFDLDDVMIQTATSPDGKTIPVAIRLIDPLPDAPPKLLEFIDTSPLEKSAIPLLRQLIPTATQTS